MNPSPVTVSSPSPGTGAAPARVRAAKPADASSAMRGALKHRDRAVAAAGSPTSRPRPASARAVRMTAGPVRRRRPSSSSATRTMTGVAPIVTRVARLTEVSDTAEKYAAWNVAASRPVTAILVHAARPEGQRRPG